MARFLPDVNEQSTLDHRSSDSEDDEDEDEYVDVDDEVGHDEGYVSHDREQGEQQPELGVAAVPLTSVDLLPATPHPRRRADSIDCEDAMTLERARESS
jgi:hypothetical protein